MSVDMSAGSHSLRNEACLCDSSHDGVSMSMQATCGNACETAVPTQAATWVGTFLLERRPLVGSRELNKSRYKEKNELVKNSKKNCEGFVTQGCPNFLDLLGIVPLKSSKNFPIFLNIRLSYYIIVLDL